MNINILTQKRYTDIRPYTPKFPIITTGITVDTPKDLIFTTGMNADTPEMPIFTTALSGSAGVNAGLLLPTRSKTRNPVNYRSQGSYKIGHRPTLPRFTAVPSALAGLTSLFGMGRGRHRRYRHLKVFIDLSIEI